MGVNIHNPKEYCENFLMIRDKEQNLRHLRFKPAQQNLYDVIKEEHEAGRPVRLIVLKGRQEGISTLTEGLMFQDAATRRNVHTLIVAHKPEATTTLFEMNKLFYDCLPRKLQPMQKNNNAKRLVFENPSKNAGDKRKHPGLRSAIACVTAKDGIGRSQNFNNVHLSEVAFWQCRDVDKVINGIMQSVPKGTDTMVVIESTANGYNEFQKMWAGAVAGTNIWRPVFLPWYLDKDYREPVEPGTVWTEEEEELRRTYGLDDEQLSWRRWCIKGNCGGSVELFHQEYPNTPDEAFLLSGESFFDKKIVMARRMAAPKPVRAGRFEGKEPESGGKPEGWTLQEAEKGVVKIYQEPQEGHPYVIGGDTAGEGSDAFTAYALDNSTGQQVAEIHMNQSEIDYARQLYCLGYYYNTALLAPEINFSTYPEKKLEEWNYPKIYQRERFDTFKNQMVKSFGWATNSKTRPMALAGLQTIMKESPELVVSYETLGEMLVFIYDGPNRKPQAAPGEHDDLVMAAAIAYQARGQQRYTVEAQEEEKKNWTADMREDYRRADPETRKRLLKEWGPPR